MSLACIHCGQVPDTTSLPATVWSGPCKKSSSGMHDLGGMDSRIAEMNEITKHVVAGGSTRSEQAPRYDLIPPAGPRRIAARFAFGAVRHGEGNWKKSVHAGEKEAREFCVEAYNHMMEHAQKMAAGEDRDDDHLGAIGWAVCALAYAEECWDRPWTEFER